MVGGAAWLGAAPPPPPSVETPATAAVEGSGNAEAAAAPTSRAAATSGDVGAGAAVLPAVEVRVHAKGALGPVDMLDDPPRPRPQLWAR